MGCSFLVGGGGRNLYRASRQVPEGGIQDYCWRYYAHSLQTALRWRRGVKGRREEYLLKTRRSACDGVWLQRVRGADWAGE